MFCLFLRETARAGERQGERGTEDLSALFADSSELSVGLELMNPEITT